MRARNAWCALECWLARWVVSMVHSFVEKFIVFSALCFCFSCCLLLL